MKHEIIKTTLGISEVEKIQQLFNRHKKLLEEYVSKLLWWNEKINLVSRDVSRETLRKHIEHSLVISASDLFKNARRVIDSGTGGGLPGLPLAIAFPGKQMILNDIVTKKVMACKHIASALELQNVSTYTGSVEKIELEPDALLISKHAFKINDMIKMVDEKPWSGIILLKGMQEIEQELDGINIDLHIHIHELESSFKDSFYTGKAMIEIKRKANNE